MKWHDLRALTLAGSTAAALVIACDPEVPNAVDGALVDVQTNPEAAADGGRSGNAVPGPLGIPSPLGGRPRPLVFVDGVEVGTGTLVLDTLDPDDIDRIEVIKGEVAVGLFGDRAEGGTIRIFTRVAQPPQPEGPPTDEQRTGGPGFD